MGKYSFETIEDINVFFDSQRHEVSRNTLYTILGQAIAITITAYLLYYLVARFKLFPELTSREFAIGGTLLFIIVTVLDHMSMFRQFKEIMQNKQEAIIEKKIEQQEKSTIEINEFAERQAAIRFMQTKRNSAVYKQIEAETRKMAEKPVDPKEAKHREITINGVKKYR